MDADRSCCWGFSLFCDDIRDEVGGKISVMGLYQADFLIQSQFPTVISKLCILIMYYEVAGSISGDVEFRLHAPGDEPDSPSMKFLIPRKDLPNREQVAAANKDEQETPENIFHLRVPIILSPARIKQPGLFKVRAHYDDGKILRLGRLNVRSLSPDEANKLGIAIQELPSPGPSNPAATASVPPA